MIALILLAQNTSKLAFGVFHFVSLIDDDVLPVVLVEPQSVLEDEVVSCETDVPFGGFHDTKNIVSGGRVSSVNDFTNGWGPFFELVHPVRHGGQWDDNQKGAIIFLELN